MTFLQPPPRREPFLRAPPSVLWLIAALVLVQVVVVLAPPALSDAIVYRLAFIPARYSHPDEAGGLVALAIPWIGHMFLHGSFVHLAVNCAWLLPFGPVVAKRCGPLRFLALFLTCGIAGAAAYLAMNWDSQEAVIGASGAISGIMAAGIRIFPWAGRTAGRGLVPVFSPVILLFTAVWLGTNYVFGILGFGTGTQVQQIAWQAHMGGYVAGLLLIGLFQSANPPQAAGD